MDADNRVFPFFSKEEIKENSFIMMLMAQNELFERVNDVKKGDTELTKEQFFVLLQNSPDLTEMLREAVISSIKLIDWGKCHDIATAKLAMRQKEETQIRRDNIKFV